MSLPSLLLSMAALFASTDQASTAGSISQGPPGIELLNFIIGPGTQTRLKLDDERYEARSSGLDRTRDGDTARNTTSVMQGQAAGAPMDASMSTDPFVGSSLSTPIIGTSTGDGKLVSEKGLFATAVIRNTGTKTIKIIDWDFPHPHIQNGKGVLRQEVRSKATVKPGDVRTIREPIPRSTKGFNMVKGNAPDPSVTYSSTKDRISLTVPIASLREGARIVRVKYSDGSTWHRP
jgi:hypothetical protein